MPRAQEKKDALADARSVASASDSSADDNKLLEIGYVPSFKREFSNVATVCRPFAIADRLTDRTADQLRVQYHGSLLEYRDHLQHTLATWRSRLRNLVLDSGGDDVLHARCVSPVHSFPYCIRRRRKFASPGASE